MDIGKQNSNLALPGILVLIAIAWGIVMSPVSLDSPRPVQPLDWSSIESIPARLWEDPLRAVARAQTKIEHQRDGLPGLRTDLSEDRKTLVLTVLIPGASYFEQQEHRRRTRYAILSALGAQDFSPSRGDSIGSFGACLFTSQERGSLSCRDCSAEEARLAIPFEWYRKENAAQEGPFERVLLLWANESRLGDDPLRSLHHILHNQLLAGNDLPSHLAFRIIGPASSTTIHRYAVDQSAAQAEGCNPGNEHSCSRICPLEGIEVLSPWSTVNWDESKFPSDLPYGIDFHRVIGTDYQLLRLIVRELKLRDAHPREDGPLAVIVSEWDTIYGRRMPETFEAAYREVCAADGWGIGCGKGIDSIHRASYLRGIDGKTALLEDRSDQDGGSSGQDDPAAFVERAQGPSQLDYLRRLPHQLKNLVADEGRPIRAIGVLGSDVYDKLLILKALRQEFPGAVFFTTDLDSRLLHPSELDWTRNLIVASQFGLGLGDDSAMAPDQAQPESLEQQVAALVSTRRIPRFRDNYQTASLLAALTALLPDGDLGKLLHPPEPQRTAPPSHPRIYEIGRHNPVLLNPSRVQQRPWGQKWTLSFLIFATLACAFARLAEPTPSGSAGSRAPKKEAEKVTLRVLLRVAGARLKELAAVALRPLLPALGIFLVLALVAFVDSSREGGEPWTLFEGVSLWTTEFLLAGLILLSAAFAARMRSQIDLAVAEIDREIFRQKPSQAPSKGDSVQAGDATGDDQSAWARFKSKALRELKSIQFRIPRRTEQQTQAAAVWEEYKERISPQAQAVRLFFYFIPVAALCFIQFYSVPPRTFRGSLSWGVDLTLLILSTLVLYLVIVFALDLSIQTSLFTHRLSLMDSQWPDRTVVHFAGKGLGGKEGKTHGEASSSDIKAGDGAADKGEGGPETEEDCPNVEGLCGKKLAATLSEWLDIHLISRLTKATGHFIYYPFVVALLFALAHHSIFDRWVIGAQELLQLILALAAACVPPILIRRTAEQARQLASQRIAYKIMRVRSSDGRSTRIDLLKDCLADVRSISQGAFSPLTQNPVLRAVLIPFGGLGGLALLESLIQ